ncbi:hypothetical protein GJ744_008662 [Endocarpon pusillum]|uniref:Uncharacterized protein n=1 Tax=Endocarpon pusillum TaxID=364733 RepID=A0A8H7AGM5_9EURO|nr:hypothetical protein GJ744_008662 [Endocarpon pusillum]
MNKFRTRRKAKEQQQAESHSDPNYPLGLSFGTKAFGKNKKPIPESKPTVDLATALPSSNDFRTSLIMPNLSARFSMLREQDDPSTKIGKANDDSVLFPKRASRLNLFSHNPLTDITEVDSIRDSIRPPFAYGESKHSLDTDGYDSDCGTSMISRSRPGEGNMLFGGRQKFYKVPVESSTKARSSSDAAQSDSGSMHGRVMYENDVSLSLFQKYREKERKEQRKHEGRNSLDDAEDDSPQSPATSFSKDRGTNSSTTSVPARNSTAATSIESLSPNLYHNNGSAVSLASPNTTSQPKAGLDRNATIYGKLYGQALNQSTSSHRVAKDVFNNVSRPRAHTIDQKADAESPVNVNPKLKDSIPRTGPSPNPSNFRSASPPPATSSLDLAMLDSTVRSARALEGASAQGYRRPLSPPHSEGEDAATFVNSVQPEDRGKATALGLFNKPSQEYDEQQFSQRQLQMHEGRSSPLLRPGSPTSSSNSASPDESIPVFKKHDASQEEPTPAKDTQAHAASLIRQENEELAALEAQRRAVGQQPETKPSATSQNVLNRMTFLDVDDDRPSEEAEAAPSMPPTKISNQTHPAFRPVAEGFKFPPFDTVANRAQSIDEPRPVPSVYENQVRKPLDRDEFDPQTEGVGLNGLIRTHLRSDSDKSSICPPVSPRFPPGFMNKSPRIGASPLKEDEPEMPEPGQEQDQSTDVQSRMAQSAKQFLNTATLMKNRLDAQTQRSVDQDTEQSGQKSGPPISWQDELHSRHQRGGSTETQQEREAFNNELAERRRKVQEKLKNVVDISSRSASPAPPLETGSPKIGNGFTARLRPKSNRREFSNNRPISSNPPDHTLKATKVLGLGGAAPPNTSSPKPLQQDLWKEEEERMLEAFSRRPKPRAASKPSPKKDILHPPPEPSSSRTSQNDDSDRLRQRSATPVSTGSSLRDRSISDVAGRSKSRNGQYRDDLEKAMAEGTSNRSRTNMPIPSRPSIEASDQPERSASAMSGRHQSNSRTNTAGYFERKSLSPLQTTGMPATLSNRPSPRTPYSANSTPPILETSPVVSNCPTATFTQTTDDRATISLRGRKRSISKNMISDPTFISTTYAVATVDLPRGASLRNGCPGIKDSSTPTTLFMNPSRRRGRIGTGSSTTHTLLSTLTSRTNDSKVDLAAPRSARPSLPEERSAFSDEADTKKPSPLKPRHRLRKVSSEGGDMSAKARYQALMSAPSPALPTFPVKRGPSPAMQRMEGGMF